MAIEEAFPRLLTAAGAGEPWALEAVYRELAPAVLGYLRGQGATDPEDLTGEVFVGVVRGIGRFEGDERSFRSWVFSIAHRRLADDRRRRARRPERPAEPAELADRVAGVPGGDVEAEALDRMGTSWALRIVSGLTEDQRAVLLLRILADLSVEETARVLRKRVGAVKALQRRALAALARRIEREGVSR